MPSVIDGLLMAELILDLGDCRAVRDHGRGAAVAKRVECHSAQACASQRGVETRAQEPIAAERLPIGHGKYELFIGLRGTGVSTASGPPPVRPESGSTRRPALVLGGKKRGRISWPLSRAHDRLRRIAILPASSDF